MDHLEGPLGPGGKKGFIVVLFTAEKEPTVGNCRKLTHFLYY